MNVSQILGCIISFHLIAGQEEISVSSCKVTLPRPGDDDAECRMYARRRRRAARRPAPMLWNAKISFYVRYFVIRPPGSDIVLLIEGSKLSFKKYVYLQCIQSHALKTNASLKSNLEPSIRETRTTRDSGSIE